jgi:antitoxin HicB
MPNSIINFIDPDKITITITIFNFVNNMYTYKIHLLKEPEGGFMVTVPVLPGCITQGDDIDEAIDMAKEAIELYIEELKERGEPIPDNSNTLEYSLNLVSE